jgi:hypothetical protein
MGRPSTFNQQIAELICQRLADGESLRAICRDEGMPSLSGVFGWLGKHEAFAEQYARARETQADALADEIIDIADEAVESSEDAQRQRLRIDARKWVAAKLKPRSYGDRIEADIKVTGSIEDVLTRRFARITVEHVATLQQGVHAQLADNQCIDALGVIESTENG